MKITCQVVCVGLLGIALLKTSIARDSECEIDTGLNFDDNLSSIQTDQLHFEDQQPGLPRASDFIIISAYPMSNTNGDRWALVTLKNTSVGISSITNEALVALFADGSKRAARNLHERVNGKAQVSLSVCFGNTKFPIVKLLTQSR